MATIERTSPEKLEAHLRELTVNIGVRLAGSPEEAAAAEYVRGIFASQGAAASIEPFPVMQRCVEEESLEICMGGTWHPFPCSLFSSTPGTDGETLEAPLCFFDSVTGYQRPDLSFMRGKAVVHLGCHIESRENYRRLMEAKPAFLLFVDVRYPGTVPLADGMFPSYTKDLGALPTVNVAYMDAWNWDAEGATAARLRVVGDRKPSESQNVIGELPGTEPGAGILFVGGHHDTQAGSVGADDNACGTTALLELARVLAPLPRKRTIRLISFGAEEQLSVGSAEYVRTHRLEVERQGLFMFNFDSFGSRLGWTELNGNGPKGMLEMIEKYFHGQDLYVSTSSEIVPYTDQFAFAVAGAPGVWLFRRNCTGGRFFHHRSDDDMSKLSPAIMARHLDAVAHLLHDLANAVPFPIERTIPASQREAVDAFWEDLFGGWKGLH